SETQLYAEDINDELQQVVADLTAIEERCAALLVLHASLASKHLGVVSTTFYEPLPASTARVRILSVANLSPVRLARTSPAATRVQLTGLRHATDPAALFAASSIH